MNNIMTPSDYFGALWSLIGIRGCIVIEHGAPGTLAYDYINLKSFLSGGNEPKIFTCGLDERDIIWGEDEKLKHVILEASEKYGPELIVILATSITSVIGLDLESVADDISQRINCDIIVFDGGGLKGTYWDGKEEVLYKLTEYYAREANEKDPRGAPVANIIGFSANDYNHASDNTELMRMLNIMGIDVNAILCVDTAIGAIKRMGNASVNIVTSDSGVKAAKLLEERFGTPWIYGLPIGIEETIKWCEKIIRIVNPDGERSVIVDQIYKYGYLEMVREIKKSQTITVGVSGNNEYVIGLAKFLARDCGMILKLAIVRDSFSIEDTVRSLRQLSQDVKIIKNSELDYYKKDDFSNLDIFFGNSYEMEAINASIKNFSAFSAINHYSFYDGTPYVGFRGNTYLTQILLNEINNKLRRSGI